MVELIITEKPSSARKIAAALADGKPLQKKNKQNSYFELSHKGQDIIITSAVGHLYGLVESKKNNYSYPAFDIKWEASYKNSKALKYVKGYIDTITKLAKTADSITVACDYDVEGEVIGLNVVRFACKKKDANRMKFSTLTKPDLIKSYETKLKHLDWGQANAGETRHKLDWLYGINLSRALTASTKAVGKFKVMSAGRVQGPALKILVDREREIQAFKPEPFWQIKLDGNYTDKKDSAKEKDKEEKIEAWHEKDKVFDKKVVDDILAKVKGKKEAKVSNIKRTKRNQMPPYPFDLTTLQSEAYGHFKITPKETLALAQSLYLAGVTSYPRTSSQKLDPKLGFKKIITQLSKQPEYQMLAQSLLKLSQLKPNNGKKDDPAHPAIYPTGLVPKELKPREKKIYDLIVKRFLATFANPAVRESMVVKLNVNEETFITKGTRTIRENWHVYYKPYVKLEEITLPDMKEGEMVNVKSIKKIDKETQPPKRYNQSSIIKELEKRKLGTKATRADILDRLFQRKYIEGVKITATQLGIETIKILEKYAPVIIDEKLTADVEEDMEKIRANKLEQDKVVEKAEKFLTELLTDFKSKERLIGKEIMESLQETLDAQNYMGPCSKCESGKLMIRKGKFGRFIACNGYPQCKNTFHIPKTGVLKYNGKECEQCKHPMIEVGTGRRKANMCINSECPSKEAQNNESKKPSANSSKKFVEEGMTCPICKEGKMVLRKSFYGEFLGCNNYPKCQTMMKIVDGKVDTENPITKNGNGKSNVKKKVVKKKK